MPVFEIESGGGKFQVDAPDQATALAALQAHQTPEAETTLAGLGKSALSGAIGGVADIAGLPADVLGLTGIKGSEDFQKAYGGEALRQGITNKTGYQFHKPEGFAENFASTAGSFLPNMIGGGAGLATKLATRVALPALAAETAGELTDQNPYAKVAGALTGGIAGIKGERMLAKPGVAARPTIDDIAARKTELYNRPEVAALELDPKAVSQWVDDTKTAIDRGSLPGMKAPIPDFEAERAFKAFDRIKSANGNVRVAEMDGVRKMLGEMAGELGTNGRATPNARAAMTLKSQIDDYLGNVNPANVVGGDAAAASAALKEARAYAQTEFKMAKVQQWIKDAEIDAAKSHSGGNLENVIYQKIATALKRPEKHLAGWTKEEKAALAKVLPGLAESLLRRGGKLLGGGGGLGQLGAGAAGGAMLGPIGAIGLPMAGMGLNRAGSALAMRKLNNVTDLLASSAPSYAPNRAAYQAALQGPGLLGSLPGPMQSAVYAQLMQRPQPVPSGG